MLALGMADIGKSSMRFFVDKSVFFRIDDYFRIPARREYPFQAEEGFGWPTFSIGRTAECPIVIQSMVWIEVS